MTDAPDSLLKTGHPDATGSAHTLQRSHSCVDQLSPSVLQYVLAHLQILLPTRHRNAQDTLVHYSVVSHDRRNSTQHGATAARLAEVISILLALLFDGSCAEPGARASEPRHHGTYGHVDPLGYLTIGQSMNVS